jgi:sulfite reductase alpha subunit-like flavoprotein
MPIAVKRAMQDALEKEGEMGEEDANRYIRQMETEGRLVEECWS